MKIITKKKAIKYIENEIESLNCKLFRDAYEAFGYVHTIMDVFYGLGILNNKEMDVLWNKLRKKTNL